ncbi:hypothetical protein QJS04_geneDACA014426 [Acorus gramineus]|uniref:Reverse transcriptase n=1 Tax=Acorus gramineus TaxID=55184 RepID=A0AAV9BPF9_ACOGR|nr:hypothetical protein QJS04_geneDACA014426 [Acorus gramineus]
MVKDRRVGQFSISVVLEDVITKWNWVWTGVYGPNTNSEREALWEDLSEVSVRWNLPWCLMGDFNCTRFIEDRNQVGPLSSSMSRFFEWISEEHLSDIPLANQCFTWCNLRGNPSCAKLDRVLVSHEWEEEFPLCHLKALPWVCSDHCPLLLVGGYVNRSYYFKFENWWLLCQGFQEVVSLSWRELVPLFSGAKKVTSKLKRLKWVLKSWHREQKIARRRKGELELEVSSLDIKEEYVVLSVDERACRSECKDLWSRLISMEEVEWRQRSRELWLKEGDNNTKFFHKAANHRKRINKICQIRSEGVLVEDPAEIEELLINHFTCALIKHRGWIPDWVDEDLRKVPDELWADLEAPFTINEIKKVVFGTDPDKDPGPNGFGLRFFQTFWSIVQDDLFEMFHEFFSGHKVWEVSMPPHSLL